jgi:uncharacterized protein YukE
MAACRIVNAGVSTAIQDIAKIGKSYETAGTEFITNLKNAISEMEGATKDALLAFIEGDVNNFTVEGIPSALEGMSKLLEENRKNFEEVDAQIASNIG